MNPVLMRHIETTNESFKAWRNGKPYLHNPWHYHPEVEITLIIKGEGILFIGDKIIHYEQDDLVLIGSNLPHEFRSDNKQPQDFESESVAVHFYKDFPGADFYKMPEAQPFNYLFDMAQRGVKVKGADAKQFIKDKMLSLLETTGIERINMLFSILNSIVTCSNLEMLSSAGFFSSINERQHHRMNLIYKYAIENFKKPISVDDVARELNMTGTSFCRFFKKRSAKSFIQYINEIRVGYACKLLLEENYSVSEIAYESGFENISHFNKQFKKIKQVTPTQFNFLLSKKTN